MNRQYSFIIPVYNRPDETQELLESLSKMVTGVPFEVVIVEDGSTVSSEEISKAYSTTLQISYYYKENSGPGDSRNFGMEKAKGNYFIILDSDCLIPPHYLDTVDAYLSKHYVDCYGGADAAHPGFSNLQKAINYVMTSFLTTGGIRGSERSVQQFEPRSFNMGISRQAFEQTGGFGKIHPGEDPDLSQRIRKQGFKTTFLPNAYVYHKRRISWKKFYIQVKKFGLVRPILNTWHPKAAKVTFWLPSLFIAFVIASLISALFLDWKFLIPLAGYVLLLFFDAAIKNKSVRIGLLAVIALFVQFFGYGISFLRSSFYIRLLKRDPQKQFPNLFFK
ncbi:glycosyltransferase [Altibacter lentus]|uniref:glycosyltransferase n=1 Tax=Altibacter lentus TaxID=1223410 RepID=UPI00054D940B|nr:glycosyltransferase [Altibacter lentus]